MQPFNAQFTLSRDYLGECFDQTLPYGKNAIPNYWFPILMLAGGLGLLNLTEQSKILGGMLVALALLELAHIRYKRAWWLTRQMWGSSANSVVTLIVDDHGIQTESMHSQTRLEWSDIKQIIETELGLILVTQSGGQQYLSKSVFSTEMIDTLMLVNKKDINKTI